MAATMVMTPCSGDNAMLLGNNTTPLGARLATMGANDDTLG